VPAIASPEIAMASEIGATVPPVGIATFAPKDTLNLARHWLVMPRRVTRPLPLRWVMEQFPLTAVSENTTF
jgi:hypothetical protein